MRRDTSAILAAGGIIVALLVAGMNLLAAAHRLLGPALLFIAIVLLCAAIIWLFVWPAYVRRAATRVVKWLSDCGNYGTKNIHNASVNNLDEARQLRELYDVWNAGVVAGAQWYCLVSDANRLYFLDVLEVDRIKDSFDGAGDGHTKRMAIDTVKRIRDLAVRLDQEQTTLRRVRRFPAKKHRPFAPSDSIQL